MANAKRCDVCGNYYDVPHIEDDIYLESCRNGNMIRILRRKPTIRIDHDVMQFDACENCLQEVLDHILTKQADWKGEA